MVIPFLFRRAETASSEVKDRLYMEILKEPRG
jgi:hypothetical protein